MASSLADIDQLRERIREIEAPSSSSSSDLHSSACLEEESSRAFKKILKLASVREQASVRLRERLVRDGFSEQAVSVALERAIECRVVDDDRYAEAFVRMRIAQGKGRRGIERELDNLSISLPAEEVWEEACERAGGDELSRALKLLDHKPPRSRNLREGAYRKLVQKGFSSDVASSASRQWVDARTE